MRDAPGAIVGVVLVFHDVSEHRAMERELVLHSQRLEEADRRKDEFLSMLAHELRNPLAPLRIGVQLLARKHDGQEETQLVAMMDRQIRHTTRLVDDLVDVSRLTRGTISLERQRLQLAEALEQAREMSLPGMRALGVMLNAGPCPPNLHVDGDLTRLVQVFGNLLSNAAKFSEAGQLVQLETRVEPGRAVVCVRDQGIGIDSPLLPQVFELFVQGQRSLDRAQGGLGIGLTVCRSIVQMHGGTIEARSEGHGRGSEFVVSLPLAAADAPAPPAPAPTEPGAAGDALRVLVVDDNVDAAQTLCSLVEIWGHDARAAFGAQSALELVAAVRPHTVLLDIGLPGMNGYDVARAVRGLPGMDATLLVAVTGYGDAEARQRSSHAGCDHHLTKPVEPEACALCSRTMPGVWAVRRATARRRRTCAATLKKQN